jgi:hypothetical protein
VSIVSGFADISPAQLLLVACVALFAAAVGAVALPGTFLARAFVERRCIFTPRSSMSP